MKLTPNIALSSLAFDNKSGLFVQHYGRKRQQLSYGNRHTEEYQTT
ncbi:MULTISPECIES: hypothetical protein [unclassified Okeania]|nr:MULTISPECIES: hypothetical protein [unclassified Okeania]NES75187.1 hypothetical protein [Okeania sp. SIO1H4]NET21084.1 hypothetical protein [Okeania sp. SIO1H5]NET93814.1 hypothetical protein [Okeania sp. SIO1H2]